MKYNIYTKNSIYVMKEIETLEEPNSEKVVSLEGPGIQKSGFDVLYGKYHTTKLNNIIGARLALELFTDPVLTKYIGRITTSPIKSIEAN